MRTVPDYKRNHKKSAAVKLGKGYVIRKFGVREGVPIEEVRKAVQVAAFRGGTRS